MAIGQSKQRLDAEAKVTGRARYTDDFHEGPMLASSPPMTCRASSFPQPDIPTPWTRRTETWPTAFC